MFGNISIHLLKNNSADESTRRERERERERERCSSSDASKVRQARINVIRINLMDGPGSRNTSDGDY